jgi:hypothetical protein
MPSFGVSICMLSAAQAALVALVGAHELPALRRLRSGVWAVIPLAAVVGFTFGALALEGLSCVTLAVVLVAVTPPALVRLGIVAAAIADTWLVLSNLLAAPNNALNAAAPSAHLPQLQRALLGRAVLGYEDLFVAALLGALVAATPGLARRAAALALAGALAFDALFLVVDQLPATVPIAATVVALQYWPAQNRRTVKVPPREAGDRGDDR